MVKRGHDYLLIDLELDLVGHLKINIEFFNGNPFFEPRFEKGRKFYV